MPRAKKQNDNSVASIGKKHNQKLFLDGFRATAGNVGAACTAAQITRRTYQLWMKEAGFSEQIEDVRQQMIDNLESSVYRCALENGELALKVLERLNPERWKPKKDEVGGDVGPIVVRVEYTD